MSEKEKETKREEKEDENVADQVANYLFVGCMFLGGGLGYLLLNDQWWVGGIIGMGVGFLARAVWLGWKGRGASSKQEATEEDL